MLNYTIKSLGGFACPARFNGASCSNTFKDVDDINAHMEAKGYTITSEYHRPCDDTCVVVCVSPRGINVSYVIPEWSQVIRAYVAFVGFESGLCRHKSDDKGEYTTLTDAGLDAGLYPSLSHIADVLTLRGIPSRVSFVCPNYGEITFPFGQFCVNL